MAEKIRIATFNVENLDDKQGQIPSLDECIKIIRPQLIRSRADIFACRKCTGKKLLESRVGCLH